MPVITKPYASLQSLEIYYNQRKFVWYVFCYIALEMPRIIFGV